MRTRNRIIGFLVFVSAVFPLHGANAQENAAPNIPLKAEKLPPQLRYPIFSGIPFPRGMVKEIRQLRLTADGQPMTAQFEPLAKWPDGSFKSVLVGAIVETGPSYALEIGDFTAPQEPAVPAPAFPGDLYLTVNGVEYRLSRDKGSKRTVESSGPVRTVVKMTGKLTAPNGATSLDYEIRLTAYAVMPFITADLTVIDTRPERDVNNAKQIAFEATAYGWEIPTEAVHFWTGGDKPKVYQGTVSGEHTIYERGDSLFNEAGWPGGFKMEYRGVGAGNRAAGWMLVAGEGRSIAVMVKDFWQQFPKAFTITPNKLLVELHPEKASHEPNTSGNRFSRPRTFYFPREGGAKTYQVLIATELADFEQTQKVNAAFQASPKLLAPPRWYAQSKVFGDLLPAGPESAGYDAGLNAGYLDTSFTPYLETGGTAVTFGWRDFGDRLRGGNEGPVFYNDTHVGSGLYFTQFLRTQQEIWWWIAEKATRHWMDIDVSHTARSGHWQKSFGPGEGHMINHDIYDHTCRNMHRGHAHLSGLPDYYLLTGDPRAYEVMREVGDWMANAVPSFYPLPLIGRHTAEAERDYAWPLFVLNEAYRATGDRKYLEAGAQEVKHLIAWWQQSEDHLVGGKVVGRNDWRKGTGYWTMNPHCDNCPRGFNGCNPWMAGALLGSLIQFYEYDADTRLVDRPLLQQMLLQCMNYVVKYGWEPDKKYFVYSEGTRGTDGGMSHLLFPLAYLGRMVKKGGVPHPEHYDTAGQWLQIAKTAYDDARSVRWRGSTQSGFYGYECIWPADFWAIMKELSGSDN